ncbi:MAG: hypothetical protein QOD06_2045 [Candidatus Binatota bacterium]|nr:hypothetical protein [Candidatus Binatota bacterium]
MAEAIGHFQAAVIFTFLYFAVVTPFAIALKATSDPLRMKKTTPAGWRALPKQTLTLEDARRQF